MPDEHHRVDSDVPAQDLTGEERDADVARGLARWCGLDEEREDPSGRREREDLQGLARIDPLGEACKAASQRPSEGFPGGELALQGVRGLRVGGEGCRVRAQAETQERPALEEQSCARREGLGGARNRGKQEPRAQDPLYPLLIRGASVEDRCEDDEGVVRPDNEADICEGPHRARPRRAG